MCFRAVKLHFGNKCITDLFLPVKLGRFNGTIEIYSRRLNYKINLLFYYNFGCFLTENTFDENGNCKRTTIEFGNINVTINVLGCIGDVENSRC